MPAKLEAQATEWDKRSDEQMHQHHRWAQATTALQVVDRAGRHRPAHPEEVAGVRHVRDGRRRRAIGGAALAMLHI